MVEKAYTVLYVGTATWVGDEPGVACTSANPAYDYSAWPRTVKIKFGFTKKTSQLNCQNPDNQSAEAFDGEEFQRGLSVKSNESVTAQLTLHPDHPFWPTLKEGGTMHFDAIAAQFVGAAGTPTATLEALAGVSVLSIKDNNNVSVPWRSCVDEFDVATALGSPNMSFAGSDGATASSLKLSQFMNETQSTQAHFNADGLCATK
jgi:hypothetical protein